MTRRDSPGVPAPWTPRADRGLVLPNAGPSSLPFILGATPHPSTDSCFDKSRQSQVLLLATKGSWPPATATYRPCAKRRAGVGL